MQATETNSGGLLQKRNLLRRCQAVQRNARNAREEAREKGQEQGRRGLSQGQSGMEATSMKRTWLTLPPRGHWMVDIVAVVTTIK